MNATNKFLTILLSCLVLTFAGIKSASAQTGSTRSGIKGGINVSNLYIDDVDDENSRIGFNVGIYGQLFPSDVFTIQPELLYTTKGTKAEYDGVFDGTTDFNLNYLELPILGVLKIGEAVELHFGPYFGYLVNANINYDGDFGSGYEELDRDNFTKLDYGIAAGLGINFGAVQIGARYDYGLVKIADSNNAENILGDSKNSAANIYIAFNLHE